MRRVPNPWVAVPVLLGGLIGGVIGWSVMAISCRPDGCLALTVLVTLGTSLLTMVGVLVVAVLAIRSLGEWQEAARKGEEPPGPGCEAPEGDRH